MSRPGILETQSAPAPEVSAPSKSERLAALREKTAEARAGLSRYQKAELVRWWTAYHGAPPDETISAEVMAAKFLDPPCQWRHGSPLGFLAVRGLVSVIRDGELHYLDQYREYAIGVDLTERDAKTLLESKAATLLPCLTVRVLEHTWSRTLDPRPMGVRGELLLWRGGSEEPFITLADQLGHVQIVQPEGRFTGSLDSLGPCPTPTEKDPPGRVYMSGYKETAVSTGMAKSLKCATGARDYSPTPRTIDSLLPDPPNRICNPSWDETPPVKVKANVTTDDILYFPLRDGKIETMPEWLACVLSVRKTRHNEPYVSFVDTPSEPGRRFIADVQAFVAANPNALSDDPSFPIYYAV